MGGQVTTLAGMTDICGAATYHASSYGGRRLTMHSSPIRLWGSVAVCPSNGWQAHFPNTIRGWYHPSSIKDDGWGVSLDPSVSVIGQSSVDG